MSGCGKEILTDKFESIERGVDAIDQGQDIMIDLLQEVLEELKELNSKTKAEESS